MIGIVLLYQVLASRYIGMITFAYCDRALPALCDVDIAQVFAMRTRAEAFSD